jgi:nitrile hydratase
MNGIHDMGGMDGFGVTVQKPDEPVFHQAWEGRVFALSSAMGFMMPFSIDQFRYMREQIDPITYLKASYYEHWLIVLERQLDQTGLVTRDEIVARMGELAEGGA